MNDEDVVHLSDDGSLRVNARNWDTETLNGVLDVAETAEEVKIVRLQIRGAERKSPSEFDYGCAVALLRILRHRSVTPKIHLTMRLGKDRLPSANTVLKASGSALTELTILGRRVVLGSGDNTSVADFANTIAWVPNLTTLELNYVATQPLRLFVDAFLASETKSLQHLRVSSAGCFATMDRSLKRLDLSFMGGQNSNNLDLEPPILLVQAFKRSNFSGTVSVFMVLNETFFEQLAQFLKSEASISSISEIKFRGLFQSVSSPYLDEVVKAAAALQNLQSLEFCGIPSPMIDVFMLRFTPDATFRLKTMEIQYCGFGGLTQFLCSPSASELKKVALQPNTDPMRRENLDRIILAQEQVLFPVLGSSESIRTLKYDFGNIELNQQRAGLMGRFLAEHKAIESLDLHFVRLQGGSLDVLAEGICDNSSLSHLGLTGIWAIDVDICPLINILDGATPNGCNVTSLKVAACISARAQTALVALVRSVHCKLENLELHLYTSRDGVQVQPRPEMTPLARALPQTHSLKRCNLVFYDFEDLLCFEEALAVIPDLSGMLTHLETRMKYEELDEDLSEDVKLQQQWKQVKPRIVTAMESNFNLELVKFTWESSTDSTDDKEFGLKLDLICARNKTKKAAAAFSNKTLALAALPHALSTLMRSCSGDEKTKVSNLALGHVETLLVPYLSSLYSGSCPEAKAA